MTLDQIVESVEEKIPNKKQLKLIILKNLDPILHDKVLESTSFLPDDYNLSRRLVFMRAGYTSLPKCHVCNKPHSNMSWDGRTVSKYCSQDCMYSDREFTTSRLKSVDQAEKVKKQKATNLKKYGVEYQSQRESVRRKLSEYKLNNKAKEVFYNEDFLRKLYIDEKLTCKEISILFNVEMSTVLLYMNKYSIKMRGRINRSRHEKELAAFLDDLDISYLENIKGIFKHSKEEIDIYIPSCKLGIEINGLYWHSFKETNNDIRHKHLKKTESAHNEGISLVQFTDEQWRDKQDICKSIIKNRLGMSEKINARECCVREISFSDYKTFCKQNHISGYSQAKIRLGLYYNDELVMIQSYSKSRHDKSFDYELIRMCSKLNHVVVGGSSKLFKAFKDDHPQSSIMTYSDRCIGEGLGYINLGFEYIRSTTPGYGWTDGNHLYNRQNFQKHMLSDRLKNFDPSLSEKDNMVANGYRKYWDCGNNVYGYNPQK